MLMGPTIIIHKEPNKDALEYQPIITTTLNKTGICLWLYLMRYANGSAIKLSYKELKERGSISKQQYQYGFKELVNEHYLTYISDNQYEFTPAPKQDIFIRYNF